MDIEHAKELLTTLSDGVNPLTGEVLSENDSCNQIEIVRALNTVLRALNGQVAYKNKETPENAGKPWTIDEDELLCEMYDSGVRRSEICARFKRSSGAITSRLARLGKISR